MWLGIARGGERGGINIIDLASRDSCSFIETQDIGRLHPCGGFSIEGRVFVCVGGHCVGVYTA